MMAASAFAGIVSVLTGARNDDRDDEAVDTEDTSHDDGDDGLDDELGLEDSDGADADAGLGSAVGGTHVAENEGTDDSHAAEEKSLVGVTVHYNIHIQAKVRLLVNPLYRYLSGRVVSSGLRVLMCLEMDFVSSDVSSTLTYKEWGWTYLQWDAVDLV